MGGLVRGIFSLYAAVFSAIERASEGWFLGLAARGVFASVLLVYFLNSALTKLGPGPLGFLSPSVGAYAQILPVIMQEVSFNVSKIAFFPYGLIVLLGTWAEFVLPVLIVLGLFTRAASLAMVGFVFVMSWVDITGHHVDAKTIGMPFDGQPGAIIADQRLLWVFLLLVLVVRGAGAISLDALLKRVWPDR
jgi:putative oxidoreductase